MIIRHIRPLTHVCPSRRRLRNRANRCTASHLVGAGAGRGVSTARSALRVKEGTATVLDDTGGRRTTREVDACRCMAFDIAEARSWLLDACITGENMGARRYADAFHPERRRQTGDALRSSKWRHQGALTGVRGEVG